MKVLHFDKEVLKTLFLALVNKSEAAVSYLFFVCFLKKKNKTDFFGTFTGLSLEDLLRAAALVLRRLDDDGTRASSPPCGLEAPPLQAGQLARAPGRPHSQMAISLKMEKKTITTTMQS